MQIATRARYAVRLMIDLVNHQKDDTPVNLKDIAKRQNISKRYLEQLIIPLKNNGLVKSRLGKKGGFLLGKAPEEIKLLDIIEATRGPINILECLQYPESCERSETCQSRKIWMLLSNRIIEVFSGFTLEDIAQDECLSGNREAFGYFLNGLSKVNNCDKKTK